MKNCLLFLTCLAACGCQAPAQGTAQIPSEMIRHWVHSFEEDASDMRVFRPSDFPFPPARGRESFELLPKGKCIHHPIGPADELVSLPGAWEMIAPDKCRMSVKGTAPVDLKIIELSKEKLVVKN